MPEDSFQKQGGDGSGAYFNQPNFIVLGPPPSATSPASIEVKRAGELSKCGVIPAWYTAQATDTHGLIQLAHQFAGTAVLLDDEGASAHDVFIAGFDVCAELTGSPRARFYNARIDCNVGTLSHSQAGGFEIHDVTSKEFFFQQYNSGGARIDTYTVPVTGISAGANNQMQVTFDGTAQQIYDGDTLLVQGFGLYDQLTSNGTLNGTSLVTGIDPSIFDSPIMGAKVTDSALCIPPGTVIADYDDGNNSLTLSNSTSCTSPPNVALTITIDNVSPAAANGRWIAYCGGTGASCGSTASSTAVLTGSNYNGPTLDGAGWTQGRPFMTVADSTDVAPGQFACASGTPPFCTPGTGWAVGNSATLNDPSGHWNSNTYTGTLAIGGSTTAGWPSYGYLQLGMSAEALCYDKVLSATEVDVNRRGCDGTAAATHGNGDSVKVAAPQVLGVSAGNNAVVLNATPSAGASNQSIMFANDPSHVTGAIAIGSVGLSAAYKTWTARQEVGGTPDSTLTTKGLGAGSNTLSTVGNAWKVQPGMSVADLTAPTNITSSNAGFSKNGAVVCSVSTSGSDTPFSGTVTLGYAYDLVNGCTSGTTVATVPATDRLQFSGCSAVAEPWRGNCAATAFFFGDIKGAVDNTQGGRIFSLSDHGHRRGIGSSNWQDGHVSQVALGNGGSNGAQLDPTSYGAGFEDSSRIDVNDISLQGAANALYTSNATGKQDGIGLVNPIFSASSGGAMMIQTGPGTNTVLSLVEAKGNDRGVAFFSPQQLGTTLEADHLPNVQPVYGLDTATTPNPDAMLTTTGCGNLFANGPRCDLADVRMDQYHHTTFRGAIPAVSPSPAGTVTVAGNDMVGRINFQALTHSFTIGFANAWDNAPVCRAMDETHPITLNVTSASVSSVSIVAQPVASNIAANDNVSYSCLGYR